MKQLTMLLYIPCKHSRDLLGIGFRTLNGGPEGSQGSNWSAGVDVTSSFKAELKVTRNVANFISTYQRSKLFTLSNQFFCNYPNQIYVTLCQYIVRGYI